MRILAVTNMYPTPDAPDTGTFVEQQVKGLRNLGLDIDLMFVNRAKQGVISYLSVVPRVISTVRRFKPDLIHVMYGGVLAGLVTRTRTHSPVIVSFCGSDLLGEKWPGRVRNAMVKFGVTASIGAARRATGVIIKSRNLLDALPEDKRPDKICIIPNGIDLDRFKPLDRDECRQKLGWDRRKFHVVFPFSGTPRKRPELARAAVNSLEQLGLLSEIHQLQAVPHAEVPIWLNACDSLLLTSVHEGSPNIVKEALACDVPVVSVDVGDVTERLQGIEGCYIAAPDPKELALKLLQVHSGLRRVAGRIKMQELSLERVSERVKCFYEECLK